MLQSNELKNEIQNSYKIVTIAYRLLSKKIVKNETLLKIKTWNYKLELNNKTKM